jgi:hypothetical protein
LKSNMAWAVLYAESGYHTCTMENKIGETEAQIHCLVKKVFRRREFPEKGS